MRVMMMKMMNWYVLGVFVFCVREVRGVFLRLLVLTRMCLYVWHVQKVSDVFSLIVQEIERSQKLSDDRPDERPCVVS